ncbi:T9SS type A sorting domain-containing protein [Flavobacteriales bacterium]|nr:T9SS type A sorting domain-containing protein [Flavobacteriales bacterium]
MVTTESFTIRNSLGQLIYMGTSKSIDVSDWEKGVYFVGQNGEVVKVVLD